jgi:fibronectin type 3 domain-containing protein
VSQTIVLQLEGTGSTQHEVQLSWNAPSGQTDPIAGYVVYRATVGKSSYALLNSQLDTQTTYTDTTVQSGLTYDYVVKSVDAKGVQSAPSNTTSTTIP